MPDDSQPTRDPFPGDIVQVTISARQGALVVVEQVRPWGISGSAPFIETMANPTKPTPIRLKRGEFAIVGVAAIMRRDILADRNRAIETYRLVEAERLAAAAPPVDPNALATEFDVELRFNSRLGGAAQKWAGRVKADCVEEAIDQAVTVVVRLPDHGQSIFVTGFTADEVKR